MENILVLHWIVDPGPVEKLVIEIKITQKFLIKIKIIKKKIHEILMVEIVELIKILMLEAEEVGLIVNIKMLIQFLMILESSLVLKLE